MMRKRDGERITGSIGRGIGRPTLDMWKETELFKGSEIVEAELG